MRQRKIKNLDDKLESLSEFSVEDKESHKGKWRELFTSGEGEEKEGALHLPLYAEFGCGKGQFIAGMAALHPERAYVAFEGNRSVVYHAMQKAEKAELDNVRFVPDYIDLAGELFEDGELDGIYLNFSDPWPKSKHEKRRLTAGSRIEDYISAVKRSGTIEFRTDNDGLFDYTMDKIMMQSGISIVAVTRDLHADLEAVASRIDLDTLTECGFDDEVLDGLTTISDLRVTSEYEDKFSDAGKSINYVRLKVI